MDDQLVISVFKPWWPAGDAWGLLLKPKDFFSPHARLQLHQTICCFLDCLALSGLHYLSFPGSPV